MAELLLELLSEEIPARMQSRATEDLKRLICDGLKAAGLTFKDARAFATPRRLALVVDGLPTARADVSEERRGPRVGAPDQAVQGFLKAAGLASLDQAEKRDTGKGEFWFAVIKKKGGPTAEALPGIIDAAMKALPWPKSMRWGSASATWVRPLRNVLCVFDGKVVEGHLTIGTVRSAKNPLTGLVFEEPEVMHYNDLTVGHRFLASRESFPVVAFDDYVTKLRAAHVVLDPAERKKIVLEGATRLCASAQVALRVDEGLLEEVAGLVEWPVPMLGTIDDQFMGVPPEVLIVSMKTHQRYFATNKKDGSLASRFVVVANTVGRDGGRTIVEGNERVLRARLSDAKFFWDQDRRTTLESRLPQLKDVVFHAKLGSQADRVERIVRLAKEIVRFVPSAEPKQVEQAARLAKADLVSGMVGEFPELQGIMGRYYAKGEKLSDAVADAIGDHYSPAGPNDRCPSAPVSVVVALADKFDQIFSLWSVEGSPTGSRDPYALRRAALGVIRIIVENNLRIDLRDALVAARDALLEPEIERKRATIAEAMLADHRKARALLVEIQAYQEIKDKWAHLYALLERRETIEGPPSLSSEEAIAIADLYVARWSHVEYQATTNRMSSIIDFFAERLKVQVRERGVRHDVIDAVFALGREYDLVCLLARVEALQSFLGTEPGRNLLTAYGRAANIVRAEEKKDNALAAKIAGAPDVALLEQSEEKAVANALAEVERLMKPALQREDFAGAMSGFAGLRGPIDAFFEKVTVNVADRPEVRLNRLKLLNQIRATMDSVADFSRIEG